MEKKKIIIIGAGIAGMSAGIYGLDNNYDVTIYEKHNMEKNPKVGYLHVRSSYFKYSGGSKVTIEGVELAGDGQLVDGYIYQVNGFKSNGEIYWDIIIQAPQGIGILSNKVSLKRFSIHNLRENSFEDEEDTLYIKS